MKTGHYQCQRRLSRIFDTISSAEEHAVPHYYFCSQAAVISIMNFRSGTLNGEQQSEQGEEKHQCFAKHLVAWSRLWANLIHLVL